MKKFNEWLVLREGVERGGLGNELNCINFMQLKNGHWAGVSPNDKVFVSIEKYPMGKQPGSVFSNFKYEPGRPATPDESNEYWDKHREYMKRLEDMGFFDEPNPDYL